MTASVFHALATRTPLDGSQNQTLVQIVSAPVSLTDTAARWLSRLPDTGPRNHVVARLWLLEHMVDPDTWAIPLCMNAEAILRHVGASAHVLRLAGKAGGRARFLDHLRASPEDVRHVASLRAGCHAPFLSHVWQTHAAPSTPPSRAFLERVLEMMPDSRVESIASAMWRPL